MKYAIVFIGLMFCSCSTDPFNYREMDDYNLQPNALKNNEEVEILAFSGGPELNESLDFYYCYLVVSTSTGDTVNVLYPHCITDLSESNRVFNYFNDQSPATKIVHNINVLKKGLSGNINNLQTKKITRVVDNPELALMNPKYPTVTGSLGMLTRPDSLKQPD